MKHRTLDEWLELISQQQSSGLAIIDFCREHRLSTSSFYKFRGQLQQQNREPKFLKVSKPTVDTKVQSTILLTFGEVSLSFSSTCEPAWLANFVKALQS